MRILHVADFYWPYLGGVEQHVRSLSHALAARGHEVTVATLHARPDLPEQERDGPVAVVRMRSTGQGRTARHLNPDRPWASPVPDPALSRSLTRLAVRQRFDVIHGHDWMARSAWFAARRTGAPLVLTYHYFTRSCAKKTLMRDGAVCPGPSVRRCLPCTGRHYGSVTGPGVYVANRLGAFVDDHLAAGHVAVSRSTADLNGLGRPPGPPVRVVPNLLPEAGPTGSVPAAPPPGTVPGEFVVYVGDLRPEKGATVLFDAYRRRSDLPPLVVISKDAPTDAPVPPGVRRVGPLDNADVRSLMAQAMMTAIPSVWPEPFSIVAIESLAAGTPVVASAVGGLADIVDDTVGRVVPPGDPLALGNAIRELALDPAGRARMGEAAIGMAGRYRADAVVTEIEQVYRRALDAA